ncbi:hypothetical protein M3876_08070 [Rothia kristinae]|nr:hypothetical protein [Rothia kristinae]MCT1357369.1 hypothetical protein [Rothia kristinae]MCT1393542.1 hypothetical protein [Rothia kristinae]MCT1505302.1 hypothetical protein [Rothia kristinae]MCT2037711.1 hypothetical protein [Rothia kristinae]MCT2244044.1 hypothetical protein [Rothia kristinae]
MLRAGSQPYRAEQQAQQSRADHLPEHGHQGAGVVDEVEQVGQPEDHRGQGDDAARTHPAGGQQRPGQHREDPGAREQLLDGGGAQLPENCAEGRQRRGGESPTLGGPGQGAQDQDERAGGRHVPAEQQPAPHPPWAQGLREEPEGPEQDHGGGQGDQGADGARPGAQRQGRGGQARQP